MLSVYSYSALETYRTCPRKYKFAYIEKPPKDTRVNAATYLGNIVHRALQKLYAHGNDGVIIPLADIKAYYLEEWSRLQTDQIKVESEYYTVDDYIRIGEEMLIRYYEKHAPFKEGILLGAEMHLHFTLPGSPIKFKAQIDRLLKKEDDTIEICDYKTGQYITCAEDPRFIYQMGIYQLAVQQNYPEYQDIMLTQYFLRKDETVSYRMTPEQVDELIAELRLAVQETDISQRLDSFTTSEGNHCGFCEYYELCPAKKHRELLEDEAVQTDPAHLARKAAELTTELLIDYTRKKELEAKMEVAKAALLAIGDELDMNAFSSDAGEIKVRSVIEEKFITKTDNFKAFAELTSLCREWGLEPFFKLDGPALMKEGVLKHQLNEDQLKRLEPYVKRALSVRVNFKPKIDDTE